MVTGQICDYRNSCLVTEVFPLLSLHNHVSLKYRTQALVLVFISHNSDTGSDACGRIFRTISVCAGRGDVRIVWFSSLDDWIILGSSQIIVLGEYVNKQYLFGRRYDSCYCVRWGCRELQSTNYVMYWSVSLFPQWCIRHLGNATT